MDKSGRLVRACFMVGLLATSGISSSDASVSQEELKRFTFTEYHMGIDARLVLYAKSQDLAERSARAAFDRIAALDTIMSDYRKDSELMKLCDRAGDGPIGVSKDLFRVLERAQLVSEQSNGAFDVTVGPLVAIWRQARRTAKLPSVTALHAARQLVNWRLMILDPDRRTVALQKPGMRLDLGGIAKGYAADEAQAVLKRFGIDRALVEMGGDIVVSGSPPSQNGWTIRVANAGKDKGPVDLQFTNCGVSTSGDTEQFTIIGGVQYSHVVDPRTGYALTNRVQSTVVSRTGFTTDPLSTALTVLSSRERPSFLKHYPRLRYYIKTLERPQ